MPIDAQIQNFKDGRANLRETTRWLMSGSGAVAVLIVGSSTFSHLGALPLTSGRLLTAVIALVVAGYGCLVPFSRAVDVLRSEVTSLKAFASAGHGPFKAAADAVSKKMQGAFGEGVDLRRFVQDYPKLRDAAWRSAPTVEGAAAEVQRLDDLFTLTREACVSELVALRFDRLVDGLKTAGAQVVIALLLFTWAANPPADKAAAAPAAVTVTLAQPTVQPPPPPPAQPQPPKPPSPPQPPVQPRPPSPPSQTQPEPPSTASSSDGWIYIGLGLLILFVSQLVARKLRRG